MSLHCVDVLLCLQSLALHVFIIVACFDCLYFTAASIVCCSFIVEMEQICVRVVRIVKFRGTWAFLLIFN